jgi:selenocysteine-specific elongation factor
VTTIPYILATAGHVDHGKSALVRALTGTDPDRLPEEKARGITIELGFAHLRLGEYLIGIVDVPGHEDFVKNMVAGVGSIDAAMLVVAADDGWMPQTEEHLQILAYLGVSRGVVALSKIDLVTDEQATVARIHEKLQNSPLHDAPIVPTSVHANRGIDELKSALAQVLSRTPPHRDIGKPRLAVDRAFALKGVGTVVTGTLSGGALRRGQAVIIQPGGVTARVRNVQSYNSDVEVAHPGARVALNLSDVEPRTDRAAHGDRVVGRGDVVTLPELGGTTKKLGVVIERSDHSAGPEAILPTRPIKQGSLVQVHHGTRASPARLYWDGDDPLDAGDRASGQLRLLEPAFTFAGDRFVIRDWSEQHTLAGGVVIDVRPQRSSRARITPRRAAAAAAAAAAPDDLRALIETELSRGEDNFERASLLVQSKFSRAEVDQVVEQMVREGKLVALGPLVCDSTRWLEQLSVASRAIDEFHRQHPERQGLNVADLRDKVNAKLFEPLVEQLGRDGFVRSGATIRRATHRPALPPRLQAAGEKLRRDLEARPFDPPNRKELIPSDTALQALKFLVAAGEAVEVGPEVIMSAGSFARAIESIRNHIQSRGPATVSELKTVLNSSRRIMVPLLEKLDRDGITRRDGDRRILRAPAPRA